MLNTNISARYNPDTDWVQLFFAGAWNNWKRAFLQPTYLYHEGNEYTEITGGWDYAIGGAITKNSKYLELTCSNQGYRFGVSNSTAITIPEGATKLCLLYKKINTNQESGISPAIQGNRPTSSGANTVLCAINIPAGTYENYLVELSLPKEGVTGYICPITTAATPGKKTITVQISSIWYV